MNKKILISLSVIAAVAAIAIGGTIAYFSDIETSVGNKFVAGKFNLKIDNTCHYNGKVCSKVGDVYLWEGTQEPCYCTWEEKDLDGELYFNLLDVKPGDYGEDTVSLHIINNDAWMCAEIKNLASDDNGCEKPESDIDTTCGVGEGELKDNLFFSVWKDLNCDNILDAGEQILVQDQPAQAGVWPIADSTNGMPIPGGATVCYGVKWNCPLSTSNIIQTDSVEGDVIFTAVQSRHMPEFVCTPSSGSCTPTTEVCDGIDNDCNPATADGSQDPQLGTPCDGPDTDLCKEGTYSCSAGALTCSDNTGGNPEICNGIDDDCDGQVNEEGSQGCITYYYDADGDGWGTADSKCLCAASGNYTATYSGDCNDTDPLINPGATEVCNSIDDDCDGQTDEDCTG